MVDILLYLFCVNICRYLQAVYVDVNIVRVHHIGKRIPRIPFADNRNPVKSYLTFFGQLSASKQCKMQSTYLVGNLFKCLCSHRLVVVPWGGLIIVRCYFLYCLNMSGGLLVAGAEMRLCAASGVFTFTPFADVHALLIKSVNAVK